MSILFMLKRKLDRWVYGFNTMKAFHFTSEYRRNSIIDISFSEKGLSGKVARPFFRVFYNYIGNDSRDEWTHCFTETCSFWSKKIVYE